MEGDNLRHSTDSGTGNLERDMMELTKDLWRSTVRGCFLIRDRGEDDTYQRAIPTSATCLIIPSAYVGIVSLEIQTIEDTITTHLAPCIVLHTQPPSSGST